MYIAHSNSIHQSQFNCIGVSQFYPQCNYGIAEIQAHRAENQRPQVRYRRPISKACVPHPQQPVERRRQPRPSSALWLRDSQLMCRAISSGPREARPRKTEFKARLKRAENRATMTVTIWLAHQNHQLLLPLWRFEQGLASQPRTRLREFLLLRGIELGIAEVGRAQRRTRNRAGLQVVASVN